MKTSSVPRGEAGMIYIVAVENEGTAWFIDKDEANSYVADLRKTGVVAMINEVEPGRPKCHDVLNTFWQSCCDTARDDYKIIYRDQGFTFDKKCRPYTLAGYAGRSWSVHATSYTSQFEADAMARTATRMFLSGMITDLNNVSDLAVEAEVERELADAVSEWNKGEVAGKLSEYLGMTDDEYAAYVDGKLFTGATP